MKNATRSLCLALISVFVWACGGLPLSTSKELSRPRALKLIRGSDAVKHHMFIRIWTGKYVQAYADEQAKYDALKSAGLIEVIDNPPVMFRV